MFTNIGFAEIAEFNQRIIAELGIPHREFDIKLANGKKYNVNFAENLVIDKPDIPIILMPKDILRDLPIATCWAEVQNVAADNEEFGSSQYGCCKLLSEDIGKQRKPQTLGNVERAGFRFIARYAAWA